MGKTSEKDRWLWVLVQNPGGDEEIVGQHEDESDVSFIPAFNEKEDGQKCYHFLARDAGKKDEFQAIIFEDLEQHAEDNGFEIFVLNDAGEVLEKIKP